MEGKLVNKGKIDSELSSIDLDTYTAGKYILTLQNVKNTITGFFILK